MSEADQEGLSLSSDHLTTGPFSSTRVLTPQFEEHHGKDDLNNNINKTNQLRNKLLTISIDGNDEDSLDDEFFVGSLDTKKFSPNYYGVSKKISWQRSLSELNKNLQKICGPVSFPLPNPGHASQSLSNSPVSLSRHFPMSRAQSVFNNNTEKKGWDDFCSSPTDSVCSNSSFHSDSQSLFSTPLKDQDKQCSSFLRRAGSVMESSPQKPIIVRHFETHDRLHNQLLKITGGKKGHINTGGRPRKRMSGDCNSHKMANSSLQTRKETHATSFKATSVDGFFLGCNVSSQYVVVEDLIVEVDKLNSSITVLTTSCQIFNQSIDSLPSGGAILYKSQLDKPVDNNCMCLVQKDGSMFVSYQPKEVVQLDYQLTNMHFYLPVIKGDDLSNGEYIISIYVPNELKFEDLSVKTVDENLVINGQRRRYSEQFVNSSHRKPVAFTRSVDLPNRSFSPLSDSFYKSSDSDDAKQFCAVLRLPCTVDTRSVSSYLNNHRMLITKTSGSNRTSL